MRISRLNRNKMTIELLDEERIKARKKHSLTRYHRRRIIERRRRIILYCWRDDRAPELYQPGRLAKFNLSCNCWMCRWAKKDKIEKPKYRWIKDDY